MEMNKEEIEKEAIRLWKENNMTEKIYQAQWDLFFYGKAIINIDNFKTNDKFFVNGTICKGQIVWEKII